jgi:hypothetical protein
MTPRKNNLLLFCSQVYKAIFITSAFLHLKEIQIVYTLESGIDVGQGITIGSGKFVKKNKRRALNKHRA